MSKKNKFSVFNNQELFFLLVLFTIFVIARSIYLNKAFVFIFDQVSSSTTVLELWRNKTLTLIGPPMSLIIQNRQIFFGGLSYYIQMVFMLIGKFDPFWSTYAFMVFSGLMTVPLYYGVKLLINKQAAILMTLIYTMLPLYIYATVSLWNPYFQLALLPFLILLMGLYKKTGSKKYFLLLTFFNGILFQLHYMYIFVAIGLYIYYFLIKKLGFRFQLIFIFGFLVGNINLIAFELKHGFYLTNTLLIYFHHPKGVVQHWFADYYLLSESIFAFLLVLYIIRNKISTRFLTTCSLILGIAAFYYITIGTAKDYFPKHWSYHDELKTFEIITHNLDQIKNFNVFEFYVASGTTQKYFLKKENIPLNYDDYYHNEYLYVVYANSAYLDDQAYEVHSFRPSHLVKQWKINPTYTLYLLKRDPLPQKQQFRL